MNSLAMTIEHWAAWAPGVETSSQWRLWAQGDIKIAHTGLPEVEFLPAMFRRRLSRLSRMALRVAFDCLGKNHAPIRTIFCSRHGELSRTGELLDSIVAAEALSPTAFSMSVHNTASGLYSIAHQDKSPSSAVASGIDTLESGFIDAAAALQANAETRMMLVIADEPPPEPFNSLIGEDAPAYAAAFLLSRDPIGHGITLEFGGTDSTVGTAGYAKEPHTLSLLRFLINEEQELALKTDRLVWMWRNRGKQN
jgi:hypothetical protein